MSGRWLERYQEGRREEVWRELRELGVGLRADPAAAAEAQQVCDEMARRARRNVELLVDRLSQQGYRFHVNDWKQSSIVPFYPAAGAADERADWLVSTFEAVPMTLLSWVRIVGDVWLVGTHPEWPDSAAGDPLVLELEGSRDDPEALTGYFEDEYDGWQEMAEEDPDADPFVLPLAPDNLHKANVSGGDPYGILLPDGGVDGTWVGEKNQPFVAYLNDVFAHGGFPDDSGHPAQQRVTGVLAEGMLEL